MRCEKNVDISVIVLTYNHKNYIRKALDSILMQKTHYRYEILIADDASTDGTSDIIREYARKYPNRIRAFIREKNLGAARNSYQTLKAARGRYLATCEGDDFWTDPKKLQIQVDFLETHPSYSACVHAICLVDKNDQIIQKKKLEWYSDKETFSLKDFRGIQLPGHVVSLVRRNYFLEPGFDDGFIIEANPHIVDRTCALLWLAKGDYFHLNREMACYRYVQSGSNMTSVLYSHSAESIRSDYEYTCKLENYAKNILKVDGGFRWHKRELFVQGVINTFRYPGKGYGVLTKRIWDESDNKLWFFFGVFTYVEKKLLMKLFHSSK